MTKRKKGSPSRASRSAGSARRAPRARAPKSARDSAALQSSDGVYALSPACTVVESVALKDGLLALLESPAPVTLEINAVQRIDTAGMQLLTAFVRERESQGRQVRWRGSAPALSAAAALLGLAAVLRLPDQAP